MLYETFKNGNSFEALEWLDAVVKYKEDLENFVYDDPEAYKLFPKEGYKQASVDIEAGRAALKRDEKKPKEAAAPSASQTPVSESAADIVSEPAKTESEESAIL